MKKILLTMGIISSIILPITATISCSKNNVEQKNLNPFKHYFVVMMDSWTSYKVRAVLKQENIESKFNGWDLKMNVLSPGYGTETGLPGVIGGPKRTSVMAQFRWQNIATNHEEAWNNMVSDVSTSNVDHIYLSNIEGYKNQGTTSNPQTIPDSKHKVVYLDSGSANNSNPDSLVNLIKGVKKNENNFSFFIDDSAHDDSYKKAYYDKTGSGSINQVLNMIKELKDRDMYDNSSILIVSDHGRPLPNNPVGYQEGYIRNILNLTYDQYNPYNHEPNKEGIDSINSPTFYPKVEKNYDDIKKEIDKNGTGEILTSSMASIFYKHIGASKDKIQYDNKNLYANYDAQGIIYHDLNIDDKNIRFNMNDYMPSEYKGTPYNSYVKNPLDADLSQRRLFVANKNNYFGFHADLHFGKQITLYKGPFLNPLNKITKYILNDLYYLNRKMPFLQKELARYIGDGKVGYKTLGRILWALESNKNIYINSDK